jgi:DNA-binding response OmpR family regulator
VFAQEQVEACIILDAVLGDEDGVALVPRLHQRSTAPILLLTGYGTEELAVRAFRSGVQDYLKKPLDCGLLWSRLERLLTDCWPVDPIQRAQRYIHENLAKSLDMGKLAGMVGLSEVHLRRLFRQNLRNDPPSVRAGSAPPARLRPAPDNHTRG